MPAQIDHVGACIPDAELTTYAELMDADWLSLGEKLAISGAGWAARKGYQYVRDKIAQKRSGGTSSLAIGKIPMARFSRRRYRRARYRRRYRRYTRRFRRRYRRRSVGRAVTRTTSQFVNVDVSLGSGRCLPITFSGDTLFWGLADYANAFTEVRLLSAVLYITNDSATGALDNLEQRYLYAPSRPWAKSMSMATQQASAVTQWVQSQMRVPVDQVQQFAGARYLLPSMVSTSRRVPLPLYTMKWSITTLDLGSPSTAGDLVVGYPRSARKWMPIRQFVNTQYNPTFIGPYLVPLASTSGASNPPIYGVLKIRYQVRGQI